MKKQMLIKVHLEFHESAIREDFNTRIMFTDYIFKPEFNFFVPEDKHLIGIEILGAELRLALERAMQSAKDCVEGLLKDKQTNDSDISVLRQSGREADEVEHQ